MNQSNIELKWSKIEKLNGINNVKTKYIDELWAFNLGRMQQEFSFIFVQNDKENELP